MMKSKTKTKLLASLLVGSLCAAAVAGGSLFSKGMNSLTLADGETAYALSEIFKGTGAVIDASGATTQFTFSSGDKSQATYYRRNVALQWKASEAGAVKDKYFSTTFTLTDTNFDTLSMVVETASATATKDEKSVNKVTFTKEVAGDPEVVTVKANVNEQTSTLTVEKDEKLTITLDTVNGAEEAAYGEYFVFLSKDGAAREYLGKFENVGSTYAEYIAGDMTPFYFQAKVPDGENSTIKFEDLNGQSFALEGGDISDTAKPVLVVGNSSIGKLRLGEKVSLDLKAIDVLAPSKDVSVSAKYYQFNPTSTEIKYEKDFENNTTAFFETVYEEGGVKKTVYNHYDGGGKEYVSVMYYASDAVYKNTEVQEGKTEEESKLRAEIELVWYADGDAKKNLTTAGTAKDYIVLDRNEDGPQYTFLSLDDANSKNKSEDMQPGVKTNEEIFAEYQALVDEAAKDKYVGEGEYVYLPSLMGLIDDNDGYKNLRFGISYKKNSDTSVSSQTNLMYNEVQLPVRVTGNYEFKFFATDHTGNAMKYYLDGELVELDQNNVWEIDEIPSFTFKIESTSDITIDVSATDSRSERKVIDSTYSFAKFTVKGANESPTEQLGLFRIDVAAFNAKMQQKYNTSRNYLTVANVYGVTYQMMAEKYAEKVAAAGFQLMAPEEEVDYFKGIYAECLLEKIIGTSWGLSVSDLTDEANGLFRRIAEYDSSISETEHSEEWEKNNKYNWIPGGRSFKTAEEGVYMVLASYTADAPARKVAAYKVIVAEDKVDVLPGENNWLQNNLASVILFSVAGVMLIMIIVLLFVKTDKQTLEAVDEKLAADEKVMADEPKKTKKKSKKAKKESQVENKEE